MRKLRPKRKSEKPSIKNQIIKENFKTVETFKCTCALEGCNEIFEIKIYPKIYVYPKYCPDHRQEYRRKNHLRMLRKVA